MKVKEAKERLAASKEVEGVEVSMTRPRNGVRPGTSPCRDCCHRSAATTPAITIGAGEDEESDIKIQIQKVIGLFAEYLDNKQEPQAGKMA
jgi:hypothetical protein